MRLLDIQLTNFRCFDSLVIHFDPQENVHVFVGDNGTGKSAIMIDEIDLHLHSNWQQTIVPDLQRTFPNIQLILTTHSPQVLTSIHSRSVRILRQGKLLLLLAIALLGIWATRLSAAEPAPKERTLTVSTGRLVLCKASGEDTD